MLPFSENLKLNISSFRKTAIGSKQWTCMVCIRCFDKVYYALLVTFSPKIVGENPHINIEIVDVMWNLHISKLKMCM